MTDLFLPIGNRRARRVFTAVFLVLLALPLAAQLAGWNNDVAMLERREPAPLPGRPHAWQALQDWPSQFERWLVDRAGFRSALVFANSFVEVELFRHSTNADVVLGRDGWLFYAGDRTFEQLRGTDVFTPEQLDRWIDRMDARRAWLAERGIPFLIVVVPDKERVYHDFLPPRLGTPAAVTRLSQIRSRLAQRGSALDLLDLSDAMATARTQVQAYAKRDTHWSGAGAFLGYLEIMRRLQKRLPKLEPLRAEQVHTVAFTYPARELDLMRMLGLGWAGRSETLDYPLPLDSLGWTTQREDSSVDGAARTRLTSTRAGAPSVVWFHDSFSNTLAVYLNATFSTAILQEHQSSRFDKALIEQARPDAVVYEIVERFLAIEPE